MPEAQFIGYHKDLNACHYTKPLEATTWLMVCPWVMSDNVGGSIKAVLHPIIVIINKVVVCELLSSCLSLCHTSAPAVSTSFFLSFRIPIFIIKLGNCLNLRTKKNSSFLLSNFSWRYTRETKDFSCFFVGLGAGGINWDKKSNK